MGMENNENKMWLVCLKSKKEPIRVEAASVKNVNGQYVFKDASGGDVGLYNISAVEGYSVESRFKIEFVRPTEAN